MNEQDDLIGDLIAEVARSHGVAISRDDPIVAVVLLNRIVLRRYLEETVVPATEAIRDATNEAIRQIEQFAEAQATWLEQVSLRDRTSFFEDQQALHEDWKKDMQALIEGQNSALQQVVMQTVSQLRTQTQGAPASPPMPEPSSRPSPSPGARRWPWILAGGLIGLSTTTASIMILMVSTPLLGD